MDKVTKPKNPGRVAQGHKLAALMKQRKADLLKNKEQSAEQPTVQPAEQSTVQSAALPVNFTVFLGLGLALGVGVCFYIRRPKAPAEQFTIIPGSAASATPVKAPVKNEDLDIFMME